MGQAFADIVLNGGLLAAVPVALLAGIVSFVSPCVLPLVPGYIGYVTGAAGERTGSGASPRRGHTAVVGVALFVLGFSATFVLIGAGFGAVGWWLWEYQEVITRVLGALIIVLGLTFVGFVPWLQSVVKPRWRPRIGLAGAPLLGVVFAIGWSPCTGPVLAAISALGVTTGSALSAAVLSFVYCIGLGLPFLVLAAGFGWASRSVAWIRRHIRVINLLGGLTLVLLGLLLVTGLWNQWILSIQGVIAGYAPAI